MTADETTVLLGFIQGIDRRTSMDERAISAWMNVLPKDMTLNEAMSYVREHYLEQERMVLPAHLVAKHRLRTKPIQPPVVTDHECLNGYVLVEQTSTFGFTHMAAAPCPKCKGRKA